MRRLVLFLEMTLVQGQSLSRTSPFILLVVFRKYSDFKWSIGKRARRDDMKDEATDEVGVEVRKTEKISLAI